jgi:hypothetical protein
MHACLCILNRVCARCATHRCGTRPDLYAGARFLLEEGKLNLTIRLLVEFKDMQRNEMFAQVCVLFLCCTAFLCAL